jgi:cyclase
VVRDMVFLLLILSICMGGASSIAAQAADDWRSRFAAGEQAREDADFVAYADEMAAAAEALPGGHLNRPFVQYHAARAASLAGRPEEAVAWLRTAWDENIEALMISFARYDPAFDPVKGTAPFIEVMGLAAEMTLDVRRLRDDVHLIQGAGANVVAQVGPDGVLLVDTGYDPALPALRAALSEILGGAGTSEIRDGAGLPAAAGGTAPVMVVLTHAHEDHMGSTPALGPGAVLLAHPGTAALMREPFVFMEGVEAPPKPRAAWPDIEVARDSTFVFNGESIRLAPTVAHTTGDLSVYFTQARVLHLGDTWLAGNPMMYPGTSDPGGFLDRLEAFLDSLAPETIVVGGHDPPTDVGAVRAQIAASRACMELVRGAIADGLDAAAAAERAGDRFPPQWVGFFHRVLTGDGGA